MQKKINIQPFRNLFFLLSTGNYVLGYLASRPKLVHYVLQALVQLFARITKLGWFDIQDKDYVFRNVITDVTKFIQSGSTQHVMIGVQLLSQLVCEMNQVSEADSSRSLTKHRKIASSFRDLQLFEIFQLSCELLQTAAGNIKSMDFSDDSQHGLISHALRLAHNCLTFDFIGTSTDETADDLCTVQIPTGWRSGKQTNKHFCCHVNGQCCRQVNKHFCCQEN